MVFIVTKYLLTAGLMILVSELAKGCDKIGALGGSLFAIFAWTVQHFGI